MRYVKLRLRANRNKEANSLTMMKTTKEKKTKRVKIEMEIKLEKKERESHARLSACTVSALTKLPFLPYHYQIYPSFDYGEPMRTIMLGLCFCYFHIAYSEASML